MVLLTTLSKLFTLAFVVTSMLSIGLSLTIPQILAPLRNGRLVVIALLGKRTQAAAGVGPEGDYAGRETITRR